MFYRALFFVAVFAAVVSLVFQSVPAALAAGIIGAGAFAAKELDR